MTTRTPPSLPPSAAALAWIRGRWIPALRGGTYRQTTSTLRRTRADGTPAYCCLGVACELAIADDRLAGWEDGDEGASVVREAGIIYDVWLPPSLRRFLGIGCYGPGVRIATGRYGDLARANDGGADFAEIADALASWCDEWEATG